LPCLAFIFTGQIPALVGAGLKPASGKRFSVGVQLSAISFQQKQKVRQTDRETSDLPFWNNYLKLKHWLTAVS